MTHPELQEQIDHLNRCDAYDVIAVPRRPVATPQQQKKDKSFDVLAAGALVALSSGAVATGFLGLRGMGFFQTPAETLTKQNTELSAELAAKTEQINSIQKAVCGGK